MNVLILGATSSIARAIAIEFAAQGATLYLASRDEAELTRIATDLHIRFNVDVKYGFFDAEDLAKHGIFWQQALQIMSHIDGVVLALGHAGTNENNLTMPLLNKIITCNFTGTASILSYCADYFAAQKKGFIIGISSVAGDRGRKKNYVYGAAKAGLTVYLQGLRNRLFSYGIRVITVKPGFVDTAMTFGLPHLFLVANPTSVAKTIVKSLKGTRDIIYVPWFWRYIMGIIKLIPEKIFKRLDL